MNQNEYESGSAARRQFSSASTNRSEISSLASSNSNYSILYLIKRFFLYSLPHVVIISLFLTYSLLGAAILNEIESSNQSGSSSSSTSGLHFDDLRSRSVEKYESQLGEKHENILKQHTEKTHSNLNYFYTSIGVSIRSTLNITRRHHHHQGKAGDDSKDDEGAFDANDLETFEFFARLYKKHKSHMNLEKMFKTMARHMVEFKARLKANLTHALKDVVDDFATNQVKLNRELDSLLRKGRGSAGAGAGPSDKSSSFESQHLNWRFSNYAYFIGSYLTTIGFGSASPHTVMGKLFTMIYLIIGLPFTLIVLSDLGSLLTRSIKFAWAFACTVYHDGYYERFKSRLDKRRRALIDTIKSSATARRNKLEHGYNKHRRRRRRRRRLQNGDDGNSDGSSSSDERSSSRSGSDEDDDEEDEEDEEDRASVKKIGLWRSLIEIGYKCMQQSNEEFDFSLGSSIGFVFIYLALGAFMISRVAKCTFFDGYYSSLIALTKISCFGDLIITTNQDTESSFSSSSSSSQLSLALAVYALLGMAFLDLTVLSLQEKMRLLLIKNARHILGELVKFANQLGYSSWTMDSINLDNIGKNSILKIYSQGPVKAQVAAVEQDIEDVFYSPNYLKRDAQRSSFRSKKKPYADGNYYHNHIAKCDKQTQITTLLCTKFKYEKLGGGAVATNMSAGGLSSSLGSIPESVISMSGDGNYNDETTSKPTNVTDNEDSLSPLSSDANRTTIEVFRKDDNGNASLVTPSRRSRFNAANSNLKSSFSYQQK